MEGYKVCHTKKLFYCFNILPNQGLGRLPGWCSGGQVKLNSFLKRTSRLVICALGKVLACNTIKVDVAIGIFFRCRVTPSPGGRIAWVEGDYRGDRSAMFMGRSYIT